MKENYAADWAAGVRAGWEDHDGGGGRVSMNVDIRRDGKTYLRGYVIGWRTAYRVRNGFEPW